MKSIANHSRTARMAWTALSVGQRRRPLSALDLILRIVPPAALLCAILVGVL